MRNVATSLAVLLAACIASAVPTIQLKPGSQHSLPGYSDYYSNCRGKAVPYPGNETDLIFPTTNGAAASDDLLFQNLLSPEWAIFSFYQAGVEMLNALSFTALGLPNNTYDRVQEIRDNEAGHLAIFQSQISSNSLKPGSCKYRFGFTDAESFVVVLTLLETASMTFLTGLVQQANTLATRGATVAIAATESRHNTWALMDLWESNPIRWTSRHSIPLRK